MTRPEISRSMQFNALLFERVRSGTVASLAIVPLAPLFKAVGLRIGHCGPKFTDLFFNNPLPWQMGASTVLPGLIGHVIFGAVIGLTSKRFVVGTNLRLTWM